MRIRARLLRTVLFVVAMAPSAAFAQASIAGTVRDSSGAVLPGATVEAASPSVLLTLDRDAFVTTVTGHRPTDAWAESVVADVLAEDARRG